MKKYFIFGLFGLLIVLFGTKQAMAETVQLSARPSGDSGIRRNNEMRWFTHSSLEPTGLYVEEGDVLKVTVENPEDAQIVIGQYGVYSNLNDGAEYLEEIDLVNGENTITMKQQIGQVYIKNCSDTEYLDVTINGGRKSPIYRLGETTDQEFFEELDKYKDAPFFELVGDNIFGTFQMRYNKEAIQARTQVKDLVEYLDQIVVYASETRGLYYGGGDLGINQKSNNRIQIINPDDGGGSAFATDNYVSFHHKGGFTRSLFAWKEGDDMWGLWHEIGHTFQNTNAMWSSDHYVGEYPGYSLNEVTVNLVPLYIQNKLGLTGRNFNRPALRENVKKYLNGDNKYKDFDTASINPEVELTDPDTSVWIKLSMYNQLMLAYGFDVFAHINQEYRLMLHSGEKMPTTNEDKRQLFMSLVSKVTQRNLKEYFEMWGLRPNQAVQEEMAKHPKPSVPIEDNLLPGNDEAIVDHDLGDFGTPTASISNNIPFVLGATDSDYNLSDLIDPDTVKNSPSGEKTTVKSTILVTNDLLENSSVKVRLTNPQGISNLLDIPLNKSYGNAISMTAYSTQERAIFTLQKKTHTIETFTDEGRTSNLNSGTGKYVTFFLYDAQGNVKKKISANREEPPQEFIHSLRNIPYVNGDIVRLTIAENGKLQSYKNGEIDLTRDDSSKEEYFHIEKDQFVRIDPADTKPTAETVNKTINIGNKLPDVCVFLKNINGLFGSDKVSAQFKTTPNINTVGEKNVAIILEDKILGTTKEIETNLTVSYDNSLALGAYSATDIRGVIRLDAKEQKVVGFSNPDRTTNINGSSDSTYWQLKILRKGKVLFDESVTANETPFEFIEKVNGFSYEEGDIVFLYAQQSMVNNYHDNQRVDEPYERENYFEIKNNQFVLKDKKSVMPSGEAVPQTLRIGDTMPDANAFVKNVDGFFGADDIFVAFKTTPNINTAGEKDVAITLEDKVLGTKTEIDTTITVSYDNSLSLGAYLATDIRGVIRLDAKEQKVVGFSNPDRATNISDGDSKYWQIKILRKGKVLFDASVNANETPFEFIEKVNGFSYEEGDIVFLYAQQSMIDNYHNNQRVDELYERENYFEIKNNQFVKLTAESPELSIENSHLIYETGEKVTEDDILEDAKIVTQPINRITTTFDKELTAEAGEKEVIVSAKNPITNEETSVSMNVSVVDPLILSTNIAFVDPDGPFYVDEEKKVSVKISNKTMSEQSIVAIEGHHQFKDSALAFSSNLFSVKRPGKDWQQEVVNTEQALDIGQLHPDESYEMTYSIQANRPLNVLQGDQWTITYEYKHNAEGTSKTYKKTLKIGLDLIVEKRDDMTGGSTSVSKNTKITFKDTLEPALPVDPDAPEKPVIPVNPDTSDDNPINSNGSDLMLTYASNLYFGNQFKSGYNWFSRADNIRTEEGSREVTPFVSITDHRGTARTGWKLTVRQNSPFKDSQGNELKGAELRLSNLYYFAKEGAPEARIGEIIVGSEANEVSSASKETGIGSWSLGLGKLQGPVGEQTTNGVLLSVPKTTAKNTDTYKTILTWELVTEP